MVKYGTVPTALTPVTPLVARLSAQETIPGISPARAKGMLRPVREAIERHYSASLVARAGESMPPEAAGAPFSTTAKSH